MHPLLPTPRALLSASLAAGLGLTGLLATAATSAQAAATRYEAENATISQGTVAANHTGYSGTGFVDYTNVTGSYTQFTIDAATAGSTDLTIRYANGTTTNRPMDVAVNGSVVSAGKAFNGTGSWDTWTSTTLPVDLAAGSNTVRLTATTSNGGPNLDYVDASAGAVTGPGAMAAAPYEYLGWGSPQSPTSVMSSTGVKWFTLAFMLSDGTCNPKWDGSRPLTGGSDQSAINSIRSAGGDVVVSFGGWSGNKLGEKCTSASSLAGAYQKVIDAYHLKAIDIDIENTEFSSSAVRQRVVDALKIVKTGNPGIVTYVTFGTTPTGPDSTGKDLINKGAAAGLGNDGWVIMPFDFGGHSGTMGQASVSALEGLKSAVKSAYGYTDDTAYRHIGVSSMNGDTDESDEVVTAADFTTILGYAQTHHLARFAFWSINRDRACGSGSDADSCSGVSQSPYDFTKIVVKYAG
ncbi:carbohydrate-binding protein [Streptomyces cocklensis]|uniref:CBM6 domain-containing protein n=1 Tax=Actinacidiphila cocklensis TaxID=887465 RepID=A0A9W4DRC8_9ACTN|nr:carbohydrate-binding protein [Actinacidiphila cocklensis]MDD1062654.1 carbohydrate-binding protein [Actinacidiphila cocklensis]CAG6392136.1 CBM6 domain-containing protein [Actinacidiphila cocklensis]